MQNLVDQDGVLYLHRGYYAGRDADAIFSQLQIDLAWQEEEIVIYGKPVKVPRLMCWYGDPDAVYKYSGVVHYPLPWPERLQVIRQRLQQFCSSDFNSVLGNLYRDGSDSMGWHADNEKELGKNPVIASLNFGEQRLFRLRHNKTKTAVDISLGHGDLLLMGGALQHHWRHCVPKTAKAKALRINLTFRQIYPMD